MCVGPMRATQVWVIAGLCLLLPATPVGAGEDDGRWWWDAAFGLRRDETSNVVDGVDAPGYEQQDLQLSLGLNGYIVHPLIASFRVDTDWLFNNFDNRSGRDGTRYGVGAELNVLPRGAVPLSAYYRKSLFDFSGSAVNAVAGFSGAPESTTNWGLRSRFRQGGLKGLHLGIEHRGTVFLDQGTREGDYDRQFADWSRHGDKGRRRIRLERRVNAFGTVGLDTDDLTLQVEERRSFGPVWRWDLSGDGIRRESFDAIQTGSEVRDYRLRNQFRGNLRERRALDILFELGSTEYDSAASIDAQQVSVSYRMQTPGAWRIAPFVQLDRQTQADRSLNAPRAGLQIYWNRAGRGFDTQFSARTAFAAVREENVGGTEKDSLQAYGLIASVAHGDPGTLRTSLELEWGSNQFSVQRTRLIGFPDLGLSGTSIGGEDLYRARVNFFRAFDSRSFQAWSEWSHRSGTRDAFGNGLDNESWRSSAQWAMNRVSFQGSVGKTTLEQAASMGQQIQFASAAATWRPLRYLSFRGSYREDRRDIDLLPDIDGTYVEAAMQLRFGLLTFDTSVLDRTEDLQFGGRTRYRTVRWALTSRFGGWLPIVTGTKRRGVIR